MSLPHRSEVAALLRKSERALHVAEIASQLGMDAARIPALTAMLEDMSLFGPVRALPGERFVSTEGGKIVDLGPVLAAPKQAPKPVERASKFDDASASKGKFVREKKPLDIFGARPRPNIRERTGVFSMNPRGFAFVSGVGMGEQDVFVGGEKIGGALHGDTVVVTLGRGGSRGPEGEVTAIVRRRATRVPGVLRKRGKSAWVEADDARMRSPIVLTAAGAIAGNEGDAVLAKITRYPEHHDEQPEGELLEVLGRPGDPKVEVAKILAREEILETHPAEAVAEAKAFGDHVTPAQMADREDLRSLPLCTIDPHDARDHDDAVFVRRATREDGDEACFVAWIAIADVASYVTPGSALDADARKRGCSVYLPDRAIPMLPRALSTHLCSLVEGQDRLTLAVEVILDGAATPLRHRLVRGVMRSCAKLAYEDVARALGFTTDEPPSEAALARLPDLKVAWEVSSLLRARRMRRGALDFDLPEAKVKLDAEGQCIDVVRSRADPGVRKAYSLIEELMLLANETVADALTQRDIPTVFRVHGPPDELKLDKFAALAETLGIGFKLEDTRDPKSLGAFLKSIAKHPQASILNSLLLRAMKQATYDIVNVGHFGLASKAYLHFTSPIRRYPDLVVHRAVHAVCEKKQVPSDEKAIEALREAAMLASSAERKAMEVEREIVDLHRALLMRHHLGESYEGTATGLVGSGIFVALDSPYVDALVKLESLGNDSYALDDNGLRVVGRRSGDTITLGDRLMVQIEEVSIERRTVFARRLRALVRDVGDHDHDHDAESARAARTARIDQGDGTASPRRPRAGEAPARDGRKPARRDPSGKKAASAKDKKVARKADEAKRKSQRDDGGARPTKKSPKKGTKAGTKRRK